MAPLDLEGQRVLRRDGAQRGGVEDLERVRARGGERRHRGPGLLEVGEVDEGRRARGRLGDGAEGGLRHEAERPLRAHHEVGEDVRGPVEVDEGVEAVAAGVLGRELVADAGGEGFVAADLVAQGQELGVEGRPRPPELLVGVGLRGVDLGAVGEQDPQRVEGVVAVLGDAAAHPGGVVGEDAADHGRVDRGRVGPDAGPVGGEEAVEVGADHARLRPDPGPVVEHPGPAEERADLDEDVVAHRLPGERGARGPESQVPAAAGGPGEEVADLAEAARPDDRLRDQPVDRRVGGAAEAVDRARQDAVRGQDALEVAHDSGVRRSHGVSAGGASATGTWKR